MFKKLIFPEPNKFDIEKMLGFSCQSQVVRNRANSHNYKLFLGEKIGSKRKKKKP